jgi:hypothetical protein
MRERNHLCFHKIFIDKELFVKIDDVKWDGFFRLLEKEI